MLTKVSPRAFGRSPDKAVILQTLLPDKFPDWEVGGFGGWGEDFVRRGGDCCRSPGCQAGFRRSPGASGGFYSERFGFTSTKIRRGY